jgi:hypothetical protein
VGAVASYAAAMRPRADGIWLGGVLAMIVLSGCQAIVGQTFEPGVEHIPGPGNFLIRVEPPDAVDRVSFTAYEGGNVVLFSASRGDERYLSGTDLPATLRARVDGRDCAGSIVMVSDVEYDGTLTISGSDCELRLDLAHRPGMVDHMLESEGPVAS